MDKDDKLARIAGGSVDPMDDLFSTRWLRQAGYNSRLHLVAVISLITGAAFLAAVAFLLSYARIHEIALAARVSPSQAALYPLILDTTLVIACVAALALRGASWWMRYMVALVIMILLAVIALGEALHSAGVKLPQRPTAAALAAIPWVLFLIVFGLGLLVLRYHRRLRAMARLAYPGGTEEPVSWLDARNAPIIHRNAASDQWNADPYATDVRTIPAEPKRPSASPIQQETPQDAGLSAATENGHLHGSPSPSPIQPEITPDARPSAAAGNGHHHGHGHKHHSGPSS